jgi:primosomal protein N' (replication factor Y)
LALWLGKKRNLQTILGSATPSLTSYEKLPTVRLRGTYFASTRKIHYEAGLHEMSEGIINEIKKTIKKERQAIVFVPTRAHFKSLVCKDCGSRVECPYCAVSMSVHRHHNALKCHYCNFAQPIPMECPSCKGKTIEANRIGTAEVIEALTEAFNNKELDILVGTQMLSKGHDYHDIGLSVIIGIDAQLGMPDFKAREKALALALQIAGRSGRKGEGEVLIQTYNSDFFKEYMDDYEVFLKDELSARKELYPPFMRLSRLLISHKNELTCKETLASTLSILKQFEPQVEIVGSGVADINMIAGKFRYHILLRSSSAKALVAANSACRNPLVEIDMDPSSFS